jgi:hypothetical protein
MRCPDPDDFTQSPLKSLTDSNCFLRFVKVTKADKRHFPLDVSPGGSLREAWRSGIEESSLPPN